MLFIHGDADDQRRHSLRSAMRTKPACPVEIDIDTMQAFERTNAARLQGEACATALKNCQAVGATVEGSTRARGEAAQAAVAFLQKAFAR